jgi:hypothetical protein
LLNGTSDGQDQRVGDVRDGGDTLELKPTRRERFRDGAVRFGRAARNLDRSPKLHTAVTAARLGEHAKADEILLSGELLERLDTSGLRVRRKRWGVNLKGAPQDLTVHAVTRA